MSIDFEITMPDIIGKWKAGVDGILIDRHLVGCVNKM
jgi:hypothetical protein